MSLRQPILAARPLLFLPLPILVLLVLALPLLALPAAAGEHTVMQKDKQFQPGKITVQAGDTVVFRNDDSVTHNVMSTSKAQSFNLGAEKPGEAKSVVFGEPGKVDVICAIHPKMKLTVRVE